jgi:hypothetical protein
LTTTTKSRFSFATALFPIIGGRAFFRASNAKVPTNLKAPRWRERHYPTTGFWVRLLATGMMLRHY